MVLNRSVLIIISCSCPRVVKVPLLLARWARKQAHSLRLSANLAQMRIVRPKAQAVNACEKHPNWNNYSELTDLTDERIKKHRNATPAAPASGVRHRSDGARGSAVVARVLAAPAFTGALVQPLFRVPPPEEIRAPPPRARGRPQPGR